MSYLQFRPEDVGNVGAKDDVPHEKREHQREGGPLSVDGTWPRLHCVVVVHGQTLHTDETERLWVILTLDGIEDSVISAVLLRFNNYLPKIENTTDQCL